MKKSILFICIALTATAFGQISLQTVLKSNLTFNDGLNDIWGWRDSITDNEYALVGKETGVAIVDVTTATDPHLVLTIDGVNSIWRDLKTYKNYMYVIHDNYSPNGSINTSDGILIVDLSTMNDPNPVVNHFYPTVTINGNTTTFDRAHNIYIDEKGYLYSFGGNLANGGCTIYDLKANPLNPTLVGYYNLNYLHDGFVRGDTLWGAAINEGTLQVVNILNRANPVFMGAVQTPNSFCHNVWVSDDNKYAFTTDEKPNAYVTAYNVTDPTNIVEEDRIQTSYGTNVVPHNTHYYHGYLVTSYYTSGLQVVDALVPSNLTEVAFYDTSPQNGSGYDGAWGAYPYLPSGNFLISDRQTGLFVLRSELATLSYVYVKVIDSITGDEIAKAKCIVPGTNINGSSDSTGVFESYSTQSGSFSLVASKAGYLNDTISVNFQPGITDTLQAVLVPESFNISETETNLFKIYPNPNKAYFMVSLPKGVTHADLKILDIQGRSVMEVSVNGNTQSRITHNLPAGIYTVVISDKMHKLVPQKLMIR